MTAPTPRPKSRPGCWLALLLVAFGALVVYGRNEGVLVCAYVAMGVCLWRMAR